MRSQCQSKSPKVLTFHFSDHGLSSYPGYLFIANSWFPSQQPVGSPRRFTYLRSYVTPSGASRSFHSAGRVKNTLSSLTRIPHMTAVSVCLPTDAVEHQGQRIMERRETQPRDRSICLTGMHEYTMPCLIHRRLHNVEHAFTHILIFHHHTRLNGNVGRRHYRDSPSGRVLHTTRLNTVFQHTIMSWFGTQAYCASVHKRAVQQTRT
ncbi:hypothetical protein EDC04DRAFT_2017581 [Pisolithus marmoratus]|nr:hypothetical protein EDC04DRAFT_2017581 [Pisolithus marmoratus]